MTQTAQMKQFPARPRMFPLRTYQESPRHPLKPPNPGRTVTFRSATPPPPPRVPCSRIVEDTRRTRRCPSRTTSTAPAGTVSGGARVEKVLPA
jgi:hypothetical protein